jgi:hypothetical protein
MKAIRMEVAYPFLLKVHDDADKGLITIEELREIVRLCVSYVLRHAVCDIPTNSLNKTFATMKNDINPSDYLNSVKAFFILLNSHKEFPDDKRFLDTFLTRDIYHMNRCGYILGRLENWDNKSAGSIHAAPHSLGLYFYAAAAVGYDRLGLDASEAEYNAVAEEVCADYTATLRAVAVENEPNPAKCRWNC